MLSTQQIRKEIFRVEMQIDELRSKGENTDLLEMYLERARRKLPENMKSSNLFVDN